MFGFLNCNKPPGWSSRDVVNLVHGRVRVPKGQPKVKVGHSGTLDPLAEGVLVLGIGPAVRLVPFVQQTKKRYVGKFRLAASSETGDLEDGFQEHSGLPVPTKEELQTACVTLTGEIEQVPPAYSAIWVDGQRAYERVRRGEEVEMPVRRVTIHELALCRYDYPEFEIDIVCGSGTYIRTLGIDLAKAVGSISVMTHLQRTGVGEFRINDAVDVERLREEPIEPFLQPAEMGITHLPRLVVNEQQSQDLSNGICIDPESEQGREVNHLVSGEDVAAMTMADKIRAIVRRKPRGWCPYRVFPDVDS